MNQLFLFANHYNGTDDYIIQADNGDRWLSIYQGIYQYQSTRGNKTYPAVRFMGNINITQRRFYKGQHKYHKVIREEENSIFLRNNDEYTVLNILLANNGYPHTLLNEIENVTLTQSDNPHLKIYNPTRVGGENDGIVNF